MSETSGNNEVTEPEGIVELTPEQAQELYGVTVSGPEGARLAEDSPRMQRDCDTCLGTGSYEVTKFAESNETGERVPERVSIVCAVCNGTGKITVY